MAIDSSAVFNRYRVSAGTTPDGKRVIKWIATYQGGTRHEKLRPINQNYLEGWNPNDSEFEEIKSRVEEGTVRAEYVDRHGTVYQAASLPGHLKWMRELDPIAQEVDLIQTAENETVGPGVLVVYQAAETQPSDDPPSFDDTNDTILKWIEAIDEAGLSYITAPTTTGSELLWSNKASYVKVGSVISTTWSGWTTAARRYSYDNGVTWELTPRHSSWQLTYIQTFNAETNEWETERVDPRFQGQAGLGTVLGNRSIEPFGAGERYIQASILLPDEFPIRGIQAGNTTEIGFRLQARTEWRGEPFLRGLVWIPYDAIPFTKPHEVDEEDDLVPVDNRNMLIRMDNGGGMNWGIVNSLSRLTAYHGGQPRLLCHWRSNPDVTLQRAIAPSDSTIRIKEKPNQIVAGDALYLTNGNTKENMHVQSVNRTRQGSGNDTYYILTVSRHPVGSSVNPPQAFAIDGTRILAHQATLQLQALVITAKADLHGASSYRPWVKEDQ